MSQPVRHDASVYEPQRGTDQFEATRRQEPRAGRRRWAAGALLIVSAAASISGAFLPVVSTSFVNAEARWGAWRIQLPADSDGRTSAVQLLGIALTLAAVSAIVSGVLGVSGRGGAAARASVAATSGLVLGVAATMVLDAQSYTALWDSMPFVYHAGFWALVVAAVLGLVACGIEVAAGSRISAVAPMSRRRTLIAGSLLFPSAVLALAGALFDLVGSDTQDKVWDWSAWRYDWAADDVGPAMQLLGVPLVVAGSAAIVATALLLFSRGRWQRSRVLGSVVAGMLFGVTLLVTLEVGNQLIDPSNTGHARSGTYLIGTAGLLALAGLVALVLPEAEAVVAQPGPMRLARVYDGRDGNGRPVVNRALVDPELRDRLLAYLESAPVVLAARGFDLDEFGAGDRDVPLSFHADGAWVWPGAIAHYLRKYGLPPEPDLVQHSTARGFRPAALEPGDYDRALTAIGMPVAESSAAQSVPPPSRKRAETLWLAAGATAVAAVVGVVSTTTMIAQRPPQSPVAARIPVGAGGEGSLAIDPNTHVAYVVNTRDDSVTVVNTETRSVTATIPIPAGASAVAVDPGLRLAYVAGSGEGHKNQGALTIIDTTTNQVTATIPTGKNSAGVAVDTATHEVFVVEISESNSAEPNASFLTVVDPVRKTIVTVISAGVQAMTMAIDPNAHRGYLPSYSDASVKVIDTVSHTLLDSIPVKSLPNSIALDAAGHTAYVTTSAGLAIIDTVRKELLDIVDTECNILGVAVDPVRNEAYTPCILEDRIQIIDTLTRTLRTPIDTFTSREIAADIETHTLYIVGSERLQAIPR